VSKYKHTGSPRKTKEKIIEFSYYRNIPNHKHKQERRKRIKFIQSEKIKQNDWCKTFLINNNHKCYWIKLLNDKIYAILVDKTTANDMLPVRISLHGHAT
jgi:hypothetical protein